MQETGVSAEKFGCRTYNWGPDVRTWGHVPSDPEDELWDRNAVARPVVVQPPQGGGGGGCSVKKN